MPEIKIETEAPVVIGYTKRKNWFKYFKPIPIGSPIYKLGGKLYLIHEHEDNGTWEPIRYTMDKLEQL